MKFRPLFFFFSVLLFAGCNKKLDLAPEDTLVEREVFRTRESAEQALAEGYYNLLQAETGSMAFVFGDFTTENLRHSTYYNSFDRGEVTPADESVTAIWRTYFKAINTANNIIAGIPAFGQFEQSAQDQFVGEAKFIRAYAYLSLLKLFGDGALTGNFSGPALPLQLTPFEGYDTGDVLPRSSVKEVYDQIVKDLKESLVALPERQTSELETRSRATAGAANALLARTYLYMRDYTRAAVSAKAVLDKPSLYFLITDLGQLFPYNPSGSAQTLTGEYIMAFPVSHMVSTSTSINNNLGNGFFFKRSFWINPDFISQFEAGDLRVSQLMFKGDSIYNPDRFGDKATMKFNNSNGRDNVPLIRLAEIMLTRAEALTRTDGINQEAVDLLNSVRTRSLPSAAPLNAGNFSSADDLIRSILQQRRFELAFEGFYRYDLIRTGQPLHTPDLPQTKKVLPIPQIEIDISHGLIEQNEGYK